MKEITKDIYNILDTSISHEPNSEQAAAYAMRIGGELAKATTFRHRDREHGKLWASDLGESCPRKTYYKWNVSDIAEPLQGHTRFKFLYGNILEEAVLYLAEEAGYTVEQQQAPVKFNFTVDGDPWQISGRIDAVINNVLVDVKSTSSFGFKKYSREGLNANNDSFGYRWQLGYYRHFIKLPVEEAGFLWIDKQNGHILYDKVDDLPSKNAIEKRATAIAHTILGDEAPARGEVAIPEGKSGNMKLGIKCSYCDFKQHCWRDANGGQGLKGYAYNYGPIWLTNVKREPRVPPII